jgi:hypothetical protein
MKRIHVPHMVLAMLTVVAVLAAALVVDTTSARGAARMAHCASDEGPDGQGVRPCVWDARHMGNHQGRSFKITRDGDLVRIWHRRAHRLAYR